MTKMLPRLLCLAILVFAFAGTLPAQDTVEMEGSFEWVRGDDVTEGDLTAVLTPTGDDHWDVSFHFLWEEEPRNFLGTATGDPLAGALEGEVKNDDPDHEVYFLFRGETTDGVFTAEHFYRNSEGEEKPSGTIELTPTD